MVTKGAEMKGAWLVAVLCTWVVASCSSRPDTEFEALQTRGQNAMGVDQYTSTHLFDALADGGRIELQRDANDPRDIATIRAHLKEVMAAFERGDFRTPGFVHAQEVPGTKVMAARKEHLSYRYADLPQGGEIRITTSDAKALRAVHEFVAFQRKDHRASGHAH
jgi:uncharacterized protein YjhX (UPF0386 family)